MLGSSFPVVANSFLFEKTLLQKQFHMGNNNPSHKGWLPRSNLRKIYYVYLIFKKISDNLPSKSNSS